MHYETGNHFFFRCEFCGTESHQLGIKMWISACDLFLSQTMFSFICSNICAFFPPNICLAHTAHKCWPPQREKKPIKSQFLGEIYHWEYSVDRENTSKKKPTTETREKETFMADAVLSRTPEKRFNRTNCSMPFFDFCSFKNWNNARKFSQRKNLMEWIWQSSIWLLIKFRHHGNNKSVIENCHWIAGLYRLCLS